MRNAGNDWTGALFRDEMMQSLVSHLKLDTQAYRPCVVFLNGEYWGIYHIRERFDDKYLKEHYDLDDDKVAILDVYETPEVQEGDSTDVLAYTTML
ncbi:CotH kinase family protein [Acetivibrio straminisolvens]|uniref:Membrane protein n=1 Tax=Acetivibrio straminisolvens JCM 21531 TaxID=1294263 RepID=W4V1J0_9FIRM|nr:CotH kinase family protein [Acetivibrio straminisolvens]GAE86952.1 membrane protein [Acetivibrio straminisolvens JCM 21531]